jgi:hypothetical protein
VALWDDDTIAKAVPSENARALIRTITTAFLTQFAGMPMHKAQATLGSDRGVLPTLAVLNILWNGDGIYFPGFCALYFISPALRREEERHVHSFLEFAKGLYEENGPGPYTLERICQDLGIGGRVAVHPGSMIVGAHLARSFHGYFYSFEGSPQTELNSPGSKIPPKVPEMRFTLKDTILDYKDLNTGWETQLKPQFASFGVALAPRPDGAEVRPSGGNYQWDVFICHATEDKAYVEPLVQELEGAGICVWFDKRTLEWGDDLRGAIDRGITNCRYGIVIFSQAFLRKKKWTEHELNSLFAQEQTGRKLILPIWHGITRDNLLEYSPGFADRLAKISSADSYRDIVESLLAMLGRSSAPDRNEPAGKDLFVAQAKETKPGAIAYAIYETKGPNAVKAEAYVRPSTHHTGWFTFESSLGEEQHGTREEIAKRFAAFDKSLTLQGYIRMRQGNSGDPAFNL